MMIWIFFRCFKLGWCMKDYWIELGCNCSSLWGILAVHLICGCWHKCTLSIKHGWQTQEGTRASLNSFYFDLITFVWESKFILNNWWFKMSFSFCYEFFQFLAIICCSTMSKIIVQYFHSFSVMKELL